MAEHGTNAADGDAPADGNSGIDAGIDAHGFDLSAGLDHHNGPYPAIEWFHHQPVLIFDPYDFAVIKYRHAHHVDEATAVAYVEANAGYVQQWRDAAWIGTMPGPLQFFNTQTFWGTIALIVTSLIVGLLGRRRAGEQRPHGRQQNAIEAVVQFVRDDIVRPNIHHGDRWTVHITAVFLAVLSFNLMGLVPGTGTASGNIMVTAGFAITTLLTMLIGGMREQGVGGYWVNLVPVPFTLNPVGLSIWIMLAVIELMGLIIKPAALAIRLFANMFAGHTILLAFTALGAIVHTAGANGVLTLGLGAAGLFLAVAIYLLELLVAFVQAYIFTLLSAVFIGASVHPEH
ncbi:MAG: F0F1 ATP synthase subunit A [Planctomycetota bacterium]